MALETRIFFVLKGGRDDESDDRIAKRLSLENPKVARAVFPNSDVNDDAPLFNDENDDDDDDDDDAASKDDDDSGSDDKDEEKRIDAYALLTDCPLAEHIGLKVRNIVDYKSYYTLFQLKTAIVDDSDDDNSDNKDIPPLYKWTKSSQYLHFDEKDDDDDDIYYNDESVLEKFIKGRTSWQPLAKDALHCLQSSSTASSSSSSSSSSLIQKKENKKKIPMVLAEKYRIETVLDDLDVEQTDILFRIKWPNATSSSSIWLRSWAVEGGEDEEDNGSEEEDSSSEDDDDDDDDSKDDDDTPRQRSDQVQDNDEERKIREIHASWKKRFQAAVKAARLSQAPHMWVASYPRMIMQIPDLVGGNNNNNNNNNIRDGTLDTPIPTTAAIPEHHEPKEDPLKTINNSNKQKQEPVDHWTKLHPYTGWWMALVMSMICAFLLAKLVAHKKRSRHHRGRMNPSSSSSLAAAIELEGLTITDATPA